MLRSLIAATLLLLPAFPAQSQTKDELLSRLIRKGDTLREKSKQSAKTAYAFTLLFASPNSPNAAEAQRKIASLGIMPVELKTTIYPTGPGAPLLLPQDLQGFPKGTPALDLIALRMLLDERLLADLWSIPERNALVFSTRPKLTMAEIRLTYGAPSTSRTTINGQEVLTYGKIRIFGDSSGRAALVIFGR